MVEILFGAGQVVCVAGYLYGAWLVITHAGGRGPLQFFVRERLAPQDDPDGAAVLQRYLAFDM